MGADGIRLSSTGFVWHELMSPEPDRSEEFYNQVAGVAVMPLGEDEPYLLLLADGQPVGGVAGPRPGASDWPSGGPQAHWIAYFGSDDIDAAVRKAEALGGTVLLPPIDVPGMGRATVIRDPHGATFGLFQPGG